MESLKAYYRPRKHTIANVVGVTIVVVVIILVIVMFSITPFRKTETSASPGPSPELANAVNKPQPGNSNRHPGTNNNDHHIIGALSNLGVNPEIHPGGPPLK